MTATKSVPAIPKGWIFSANDKSDFKVVVQESSRASGEKCVRIKRTAKTEDLADFGQHCSAVKYLGQRIRMSAWVKSKLTKGHGQLWIRIDGDWRLHCRERGTFDNMWPSRLITGTTDWQQYSLVVNVPNTSTTMGFGIYHIGRGTLWLEEISFEIVGEDVPLTGLLPDTGPSNLNFEEVEELV